MAEYNGLITDKGLNYTRPDLLEKWYVKNAGLFFKAKFEVLGKTYDPKTAAQLGFYWGLLLPEMHKQMVADGHTGTVRCGKFERDIPITEKAVHEILTALCGYVGFDGEHMRLSAQGKFDAIKFIDYAVDFAIANLGMNEKRIEAWRPKDA